MILRLMIAACFSMGLALAQGSGSAAPKKGGENAFLVTKTAKGTVLEAPSRNEFVVEIGHEPLSLRIDDQTKLEADKGADVKDAKNVSASDLKKGLPVRVKYRPADETAVEVRILKSKS